MTGTVSSKEKPTMTYEDEFVPQDTTDDLPPGTARLVLPELTGTVAPTETPTLDFLNDVELDVRIDLGRTYMRLDDVLKLRPGDLVTLDKAAEDPVDIFAGGRLIARGEILVLDGYYGVRVTELATGVAAG